MKKKALALVLALCMVIAMLPVTAFAAQPQPAPAPVEGPEIRYQPMSDVQPMSGVQVRPTEIVDGHELIIQQTEGGIVYYTIEDGRSSFRMYAYPDEGYYLAQVIIEYTEGVYTPEVNYIGFNEFVGYMHDGDVRITFVFDKVQGKAHKIKVVSDANGTYTVTRTTAHAGEFFEVETFPDLYYNEFCRLKDNKGRVIDYHAHGDKPNRYSYIMPDCDVTLYVEFDRYGPYALTVKPFNSGGSISVPVERAYYGEIVPITVIPEPGYKVHYISMESWGADTSRVAYAGNNIWNLTMGKGDLRIYISFAENINPITVNAGPGGTASTNVAQAKEGETVTLTVTPDEGYRLESITGVKGLTDNGDGTYSFVMPEKAVELNVTFKNIYNPVNLTIETGLGGSAITNVTEAKLGDTVTLTCTPDEGYRIARIAGVKNLVDKGDGTYTFTMPDEAVELKVLFLRHENPFLDVNETQFFYTPVLWAVKENITAGLAADSFGPFAVCNRAQVVTFLWRAAGCPEPSGTENPFTDVAAGSFYEKPVLWAVENGITAGLTANTFGPNAPCNRAQVVTFLYRARNAQLPEGVENPFEDVDEKDFYYAPVLWALENGVTAGSDATHFNPNGQCQRAQVVTFLYRAKDLPVNTIGELTIETAVDTVVYIGEELQIKYTYTGDKSALTFKSDDTSILTVNNSGLVKGVSAGKTRVKVYHGDTMLGRIRLVVEEKPAPTEPGPKAERISASEFTGPYFDGTAGVVGNYMTFRATAKTSGDNQAVTATSSNSGVVSVERTDVGASNRCLFKVKFKGAGTATITITSEDGNASKSYTITVKGSYSSARSGQLTPEEFVSCVNGIMTENGATISTSMGYRVLTLSEDELTGSKARSKAEGWVREFWPNGIRSMGLAYQGVNEDGNHVFYIHR